MPVTTYYDDQFSPEQIAARSDWVREHGLDPSQVIDWKWGSDSRIASGGMRVTFKVTMPMKTSPPGFDLTAYGVPRHPVAR